MRLVCRLVPLASLALGTAGCFDMHGRLDDAGVPRDAITLPPDVGPWMPEAGPVPIDSGVGMDAGACPLPITHDRATSACILDGTGVVPPGAPYALPIRLEGCFCEHDLRCTARIAGPFVLELSTSVCDGGADCDGCVDGIETTCALPPLEEGTWRVTVNGAPAFDLPVAPPEPGLVGVDRCWDFAAAPGTALVCPWPGETFSPSGGELAACHPNEVSIGARVAITITDGCGTCFQVDGECAIEITGSTIHVTPRELACDCPPCGGCADVCTVRERVCHLPPLEAGDYEVRVDGTVGTSRLHVGPPIPRPGDTCVPGT